MDNIPADSDGGDCTNTLERVLVPRESARPGSNRCQDLGRVLCYHYTTGAAGKDYPGSLELAQIGLVDGAAAQIEIEPPPRRRPFDEHDAPAGAHPDAELSDRRRFLRPV